MSVFLTGDRPWCSNAAGVDPRDGKKIMKLVIVLDSLSAGGIQASVVKLLERCDGEKVLILLNGTIELPVPPNVSVTVIGNGNESAGKVVRWLQCMKKLRRVVIGARPDIVLSMGFSVNVFTILALLFAGRQFKLIVGVRNSIMELALTRKPWNFLRLCTPWIYRCADLVITVSRGAAEEIMNAGIEARKVTVIHNGYDCEKIRRLAEFEVEHEWFTDKRAPLIISAGRLAVQKNFPLLLKAFQIVSKKTPCRLVLLGDGPEEGRLKNLAVDLGIEKNVAFLGNHSNPYCYFAKSDIFVLSSLWEGFPNVLCEAMACGLPIVSTDCPTGPNEIIRDGENGLLVMMNDATAMADAIMRLLNDDGLRLSLAQRGHADVKFFTIDRMIDEFNSCFEQIKETG